MVFDPVGAGATRFRTDTGRTILNDAAVSIVRGNASEIRALARAASTACDPDEYDNDEYNRDEAGGGSHAVAGTRGVDAVHSTDEVVSGAVRLARQTGVTLVVTGPTDMVTDGRRRIGIANGHPLMRRVTGTGCIASALVAAFAAVEPDPVMAAVAGLAVFGLAGEIAGRDAAAPGSFMVRLLDALYTLTPAQVREGARIAEE